MAAICWALKPACASAMISGIVIIINTSKCYLRGSGLNALSGRMGTLPGLLLPGSLLDLHNILLNVICQ